VSFELWLAAVFIILWVAQRTCRKTKQAVSWNARTYDPTRTISSGPIAATSAIVCRGSVAP
jgi:hypothetical protein